MSKLYRKAAGLLAGKRGQTVRLLTAEQEEQVTRAEHCLLLALVAVVFITAGTAVTGS
jgi:hypothetical protein